MTNTQQYIEWGIEGGYVKLGHSAETIIHLGWHFQAFLDPEYWTAVGKVRGWGDSCALLCEQPCIHDRLVWKRKWIECVKHLADGKTIDEALGLLE